MTLFNGRYRVESARNPKWDYHESGCYFVTICTRNRIHYFGSVINKKINLSSIGKTARVELLKTPEIRDNVVIDEWVIMPNHIHVIFRILPVSCAVETHRGASLQPVNQQPVNQQPNRQKNRFGPQSDNLPAVVRGFKSAVKRLANINGIEFQWQARYHDHIIRCEDELARIQRYIKNNEAKWVEK